MNIVPCAPRSLILFCGITVAMLDLMNNLYFLEVGVVLPGQLDLGDIYK
ncbi:MAG: hypothetical protein Fur005_49460 [Roseiflexaceae bacterium]